MSIRLESQRAGSHASSSSEADKPLNILLPNGTQIVHLVGPQDTTADLVAVIRRLLPNLTVGDITSGDLWLTSAADWRLQSLIGAWGLKPWAEVRLHEWPKALCVSVWSPHGECESRTVQLSGEQSAGEALAAAAKAFARVRIEEGAVLLRQELLHEAGGLQRRSVSCYDPRGGKYLYLDLESGNSVEDSSSSVIVRRCLSATSALPASPRLVPSFVVKTETQLLQVTAARLLEAAPGEAMQDETYVAYLPGVQCGGTQGKVFWEVAGNHRDLVDPLFGSLYADKKAVPGHGRKKHVLCLLRRGDRPPFCRLPDDEYLLVLRRAGLKVTIEGGRLQADDPVLPMDMERWVTSYDIDKFVEDFTASARLSV